MSFQMHTLSRSSHLRIYERNADKTEIGNQDTIKITNCKKKETEKKFKSEVD